MIRKSAVRAIGLWLGVGLLAASCGLGSSEEDDRQALIDGLVESGTASESDATCIVDAALEEFSISELANLNEPDADPALQDVMVRKTLTCLVEGDAIDDIVEQVQDDQELTSETVPPTTVAGGTDGSDEVDPAAEAEFCSASADYWVASNAGSHIDLSNPAQVREVFQRMTVELDEAIAKAPNDELAQPALLAKDHFTPIHEALAGFQYDFDTFETSNVFVTLEARLDGLGDIDDLLQTYLAGPCGLSPDLLQASAEAEASEIALAYPGDATGDGGAADIPDGYTEIIDTTDRLKVNVPDSWEDVQSEPSGDGSSLTIAPDVGDYLTTWAADGLKMSVTNASSPIDWRQPMNETNASAECVLVSSDPYDDGLYTGWIDRYEECGGSSTAVVIGATDEEFSVEILVEVQFDNVDTQNDEETLNQIIDTFKAR